MAGRDRRPLRGPRRRLDYRRPYDPSDEPQPSQNELAELPCPRCEEPLTLRKKLTAAICPGCGWLLKVEPFWGTLSVDDVMKVAEPAVPGIGQKVYKSAYRRGWLKILESWRRRRVVEIVEERGPRGEKRYRVKARDEAEILLDESEPIDYGARELGEGEPDEPQEERWDDKLPPSPPSASG